MNLSKLMAEHTLAKWQAEDIFSNKKCNVKTVCHPFSRRRHSQNRRIFLCDNIFKKHQQDHFFYLADSSLIRKTSTHTIKVNRLNHCVVAITRTNKKLTNLGCLDSLQECFIKPVLIGQEKDYAFFYKFVSIIWNTLLSMVSV